MWFHQKVIRSAAGLARRLSLPALLMPLIACGGASHPGGPVISQFKAEPARAAMGQEVVLQGIYAQGTGSVDPSVGPLASGESATVRPMATTTYHLRVTDGAGRSAIATCRVEVGPGLAVRIQGCEGTAGKVRVEGPGGFTRTLTASAVLPGVEPGEYTITAEPADGVSDRLEPLVPTQKVRVSSGTEVTVQYLSPSVTVYLHGGIPLELVLIKPGSFIMGSDEGDPRTYPAHRPPHRVTIPRPFYAAKFPTTQAQWEAVMGDNPSQLKSAEYPVTDVSYNRIHDEFLPELNRQVPGHGFRLPTEAEWEYSCRAGTTTGFFFGPDEKLENYAWTYTPHSSYLHPVGQKKPNPWGLYDLSGLVFQWCQDLAHNGYDGAPSDGKAWLDPDLNPPDRITRGFDGHYDPNVEGQSYQRWHLYSGVSVGYTGFRLLSQINQD